MRVRDNNYITAAEGWPLALGGCSPFAPPSKASKPLRQVGGNGDDTHQSIKGIRYLKQKSSCIQNETLNMTSCADIAKREPARPASRVSPRKSALRSSSRYS